MKLLAQLILIIGFIIVVGPGFLLVVGMIWLLVHLAGWDK